MGARGAKNPGIRDLKTLLGYGDPKEERCKVFSEDCRSFIKRYKSRHGVEGSQFIDRRCREDIIGVQDMASAFFDTHGNFYWPSDPNHHNANRLQYNSHEKQIKRLMTVLFLVTNQQSHGNHRKKSKHGPGSHQGSADCTEQPRNTGQGARGSSVNDPIDLETENSQETPPPAENVQARPQAAIVSTSRHANATTSQDQTSPRPVNVASEKTPIARQNVQKSSTNGVNPEDPYAVPDTPSVPKPSIDVPALVSSTGPIRNQHHATAAALSGIKRVIKDSTYHPRKKIKICASTHRREGNKSPPTPQRKSSRPRSQRFERLSDDFIAHCLLAGVDDIPQSNSSGTRAEATRATETMQITAGATSDTATTVAPELIPDIERSLGQEPTAEARTQPAPENAPEATSLAGEASVSETNLAPGQEPLSGRVLGLTSVSSTVSAADYASQPTPYYRQPYVSDPSEEPAIEPGSAVTVTVPLERPSPNETHAEVLSRARREKAPEVPPKTVAANKAATGATGQKTDLFKRVNAMYPQESPGEQRARILEALEYRVRVPEAPMGVFSDTELQFPQPRRPTSPPAPDMGSHEWPTTCNIPLQSTEKATASAEPSRNVTARPNTMSPVPAVRASSRVSPNHTTTVQEDTEKQPKVDPQSAAKMQENPTGGLAKTCSETPPQATKSALRLVAIGGPKSERTVWRPTEAFENLTMAKIKQEIPLKLSPEFRGFRFKLLGAGLRSRWELQDGDDFELGHLKMDVMDIIDEWEAENEGKGNVLMLQLQIEELKHAVLKADQSES
ncbi:hypothetical protein PWT90_01352 [Aphanocladium album]|nr:hypothetical protein PWT90_01352 [Aphanocladium album]